MDQTIGFCTSADGTRIAYAVSGRGIPLVRAATWMTHVELDQDSPVWGHWWRELSRYRQFIRYDQRGCGLSDRHPQDYSLEARVQDLQAVVDALGLERFDLLGHSHGGLTAIEYAARNPPRVSKLILFGSFAHGQWIRDVSEASQVIMRSGWERETSAARMMFAIRMMPDASKDHLVAASSLLKNSMSGESAANLAASAASVDVMDRLAHIQTPTLVLHSSRSEEVPSETGRTTAALLPTARFVEIDSSNHVLLPDEPAWDDFRSHVRAFLGGESDESPDQDSLTPLPMNLFEREAEVLRLIARGETDQSVADNLGISVRTVGNHVTNILRKTGSANRAQASAWAALNGLL
jgi:pimeloyl-ACP methyl ester carboxylesterase/DNA-binding CsgD family transcriptional regulator